MPEPIAPNPRGELNRAVLRDAQRITVRKATHEASAHVYGSVSNREENAKSTKRRAAAQAQGKLNEALKRPTKTVTIEADARYPGRQSEQREVHIQGGRDLAIGHLTAEEKQEKRDLGAQVFEGNRIQRQTNWEKRVLAGTPAAGYIAAAQLAETSAASAENISAAAGLFTAGDAGITSAVASGLGAAANLGAKYAYDTAGRLAAGEIQQAREEAGLRNPETGVEKSGPLRREQALKADFAKATGDWANTKSLRRREAAVSDTIGTVTGSLQTGEKLIEQAAKATGGRLTGVKGIVGNVASRSAGSGFDGLNVGEAVGAAAVNYSTGEIMDRAVKLLSHARNPEARDAAKERHFQERADVLGNEYERVESDAANVLQSIPGRLRARKFAKVAGQALKNNRDEVARAQRLKLKRPQARPDRKSHRTTS